MIEITDDQMLKETLENHELVLVFISRVWCGVCHALKPQVEKRMNQFPSLTQVEVSADKTPDISAQWGIFSVPAILIFHKQQELIRQAGFLNIDQIENFMSRYVKLSEGTNDNIY